MKKLLAAALLLPLVVLAAGPAVVADGFKGTENLAFDGKGALYVSDAARFWKVEGGKLTELYRLSKDEGTSLGGVAMGPGGKVFFSVGATIKTYDPATGAINAFVSGFKFANGICFDDAGNLFVADTNGRTLYVVPAGTKELRKLKTGALVNGVVWGREQNMLYYTVMVPAEVRSMTLGPGPANTGDRQLKKFGTSIILDDLALDGGGNLYICQYGGGKVVKIAPDGKEETVLSGLDGPSAAEFGPDGKLYVTIKGKTLAFNGTTVIAAEVTGATAYRMPFTP